MDFIERINKVRNLADKIIIDNEWCDIITVQYNSTDIYIENGRNNKKIKLKVSDNEESINKILKEIVL